MGKKFIPLYLSLVLQHIITLAVNLADNMMLGAYSEVSLSGVASVNQIQFVLQQLTLAVGEALVVICSQYWGKRLTTPMKRISAVAMQTAVLFAGLLFVGVSLFPDHTMRLFTNDEMIIKEGTAYLGMIRFTYFFFVITQVLLALLRSMAVVKIALYLSMMTFFVNCGINYVLIYGRFGLPEMGVRGAAIGTIAARILELMVLIVFIRLKGGELKLRFSDLLMRDKELSKDYYRTALPLMAAQGLWGLNTMLQTVILGHMDKAAIAANSVASNIYLMVKSGALGASSAAAVLIGNGVGAGDYDAVRKNALWLQKFFVCVGILSGMILYGIRVPVLSIYQLSESTREMANAFLIVLCVAIVGMSYQMPTG
ncbi:MAG: polysaccharide biosynthesis C-terminal domain-containing protein, partial [Lachnospiraceae bacterium]|nr:polysaccharide biosynthesis C-terminal domain-containing protein [Lachnospiraceae bacterium]